MNRTKELDKSKCYTFVGSFIPNTFTTLEGNEYDCMTYRINHEKIGDGQLCVIHLEWHESTDAWVIPRYVLIEDVSLDILKDVENSTNVEEGEK